MTLYQLDTLHIEAGLNTLAETDGHIRSALALVGMPESRKRPHGFATVLDTIVGQQLSVKAAASIRDRVNALMEGDPAPDRLADLTDDQLRGAGLSRQKVGYVRSLAEATLTGALDFEKLPHLGDADAVKIITQVKGLGVWSAQIYLMFALGRPNVWPVLDLGVQEGIARILGQDRPKPKELDAIGERWHPYRSSVSLLAWHYYANAPL